MGHSFQSGKQGELLATHREVGSRRFAQKKAVTYTVVVCTELNVLNVNLDFLLPQGK